MNWLDGLRQTPLWLKNSPNGTCLLTWILRKLAATSLENRLVCQVVPFGDASWRATRRTPPLWQRGFFLVNCLVVATLVGFGDKRCPKNIPLIDAGESLR